MTKKIKDFTQHFKQASKKIRELGYKDFMEFDSRATDEHRKIVSDIYKS